MKTTLLTIGILPAMAGAAMAQTMPAQPTQNSGHPTGHADTVQEPGAVFAAPSTLPFQAPDFARISDADFQPAIEQGMTLHLAEIAAIANNPATPTIANTLEPLERSGDMLTRAYGTFSAMVSANTNDTLDAAEQALAPRLAAHMDAIHLDPLLFARIKALHNARERLPADSEEARLLEVTYERFINAGAQLNAADKERLKAINEQLSSLGAEFSQKLTEATKQAALVVEDKAQLAGLSVAEIAAAAKEAEERGMAGKYVLALINTTQQPQLARLQDRETRRRLYEASVARTSRGDAQDTRQLIAQIAALRAQKAALLGYADYASHAMFDRMLDQPAKALAFMEELVAPVTRAQEAEAAELNAMIGSEGGDFTVQPWDWDYYAEKVRSAKYAFDDAQVKPYFELTRVLEDGVFHAASEVFGLHFAKRSDLPVYHPDVSTYTVFDTDGSELGLFYFDPFARSNKQGGAWMGNFVEQSHLMGTKPVVYNVLNIAKPPEGEPALVSYDDMITLFHEMGHALHGLFADQKYPTLSGTNTARDFVEFPSQFFENFATQPAIFSHFARHYQTGEPIPAELMEKLDRARKFNQGYALGEVLAAALVDMQWHALKPGEAVDADRFEQDALARLGLRTDLVPPRYYGPYFRHIWDHGYAAGYYSYIWTEMIAHDAFAFMLEGGGGVSRAGGDLFREKILSRGNTMDYAALYQAYAGRQPGVDAILNARGLKD